MCVMIYLPAQTIPPHCERSEAIQKMDCHIAGAPRNDASAHILSSINSWAAVDLKGKSGARIKNASNELMDFGLRKRLILPDLFPNNPWQE